MTGWPAPQREVGGKAVRIQPVDRVDRGPVIHPTAGDQSHGVAQRQQLEQLDVVKVQLGGNQSWR